MKKIISILLTAIMLINVFPLGIFAAAEDHEVKLELVKDSTTFSDKDVLRVDFMYKSGSADVAAQIINLRYDATLLAPLAQATGADASAYATDFSTSMTNAFTKNNYQLVVSDPVFGDITETSDVKFYTIIKDDIGYICWSVTEPTGTPAFSDFTRIGSIFFGLKNDTSFSEFPKEAIGYSVVSTDKVVTNLTCSVEVSDGTTTYKWGEETPGQNVLSVDPIIMAGEGVTYKTIKVNAATPVITAQPQAASYIKDADAEALTVTATVADAGTLTYEWFKNTTDSTTGGTSVGTDATYIPATDDIGATYYYVVITNTNNEATGEKTAKVTSSTAKIEITEDPDLVALNTAKAKVEAAAYGPIAHKDYADETAVAGYAQTIAGTAAGDGITATVNKVSYAVPVDGTAADADGKGTDGTYTFTVTLAKNGKEVTTDELSLTVEATAFQGITDAQAVAAAMAITGGTVNVDYGADQTAKTAAVQAYVNAELAEITDAAGVTATVVFKSGNTYTVTYKKNAETDSNEIEMTIEEGEDPDIAIVEAAKTAAESAEYANMAQSAATDTDAIKAQLKAAAGKAVNNSEVTVDVVEVSYTEAAVGTSADVDGENGSYSFKIKVSKGIRSAETTEKSITITATQYTGVSDVDAVAAAKNGLANGSVNVPYGATQEDKTTAVQNYVNTELAKITEAAGVSAVVTYDTGDKYIVSLNKGSVNDTATLEMTVNIGVNPAIAIVEAALNAVNGDIYDNMTQAEAASEDVVMNAVKVDAVAAVKDTRVTVSVVDAVYTPAVAGTSAKPAGTNGSYTFKIQVANGDQTRTTEEKSIVITATAYDGITDVQAVEAAKNAIVDDEVIVPFGTSDEDKLNAVQEHFDSLMVGAAEGVTVTITSVDDDQYTVELRKNDTVDTKTVTITVTESADPDIQAVADAKNAAENAEYADIAQAAANSEAAVKAMIQGIAEDAVANDSIEVTVNTVGDFVPAEAGSASTTKEGVNGSYTFTVTVTASKGDPSATTEEKTIAILATAFNGVLDADAVAAAEAALKDGEVIVSIGAADSEIEAAIEEYINDALVGDAAGVAAVITAVNGDEFTIELTKGTATAAKTITITVKEAEPEELDVPANLKFRDGVASWNAVTNAETYIVRLYEDGSKIYEVEITATTYDFNSMIEEDKSYVFTVEATGDGVNYLNSDESAESAAYTVPSNDKFWDDWYRSIMILFNQKYTITASAGDGGSITPAGKAEVKYSNSITYTITPDEGYEIESVVVDGKNVGVTTEYTFKNVRAKHTISVEFVKIGWDNPFVDVFETDAYYEAIEFVYKNGLFKGVSDNEFAPDTTMTRAMFVTVLGRLAGIDATYYTETSFDDVVLGTWYAPYVEWAASEGIVLGYGNGVFGVEDKITVEQAVVIMARYAEYAGISTKSSMKLGYFSDAADVADWAVEQMEWIVGEDIYDGEDGKLTPKAPAKRSLIAEILFAFVTKFGE